MITSSPAWLTAKLLVATFILMPLFSLINPGDPAKIKVVIDPGHGGLDDGTAASGKLEKEYVLMMSRLLMEELEKRGAQVTLTRERDEFVSLDDRIKVAKDNDADVFLSLHMNAVTAGNAGGMSIYYYNDEIQKEAQSLANALYFREMGDTVVGKAGFFVLKNGIERAFLIHLGYITNREDMAYLSKEENRRKIVRSIARHITD